MEQYGDDSLASLSRVMQHWRAVDDREAMARLIARAVAAQRTRRLPHDPRRIAAALLGGAGDPALVGTLVARLPLALRWRSRVPVLTAASLVLLAAAAGAMANRSSRPDLLLGVSHYDKDGRVTTSAVPIKLAQWDSPTPYPLKDHVSLLQRHLGDQEPEYAVHYTPNGDSAVTTLRRPGTSNLDIALLTRDSLVWLTSSERDDVAPQFAPDGRQVVFLTSRWSPAGDDDADVAVLSLEDGSIRQVTTGPDVDSRPVVSLDGTRIAFVRHHRDDRRPLLCVVPWQGDEPTCVPSPGLEPDEAAAWLGMHRIAVIGNTNGMKALAAVEVPAGEWSVIAEGATSRVTFDPGSGALACVCEDPTTRRLAVRVARGRTLTDWRTIALPPSTLPGSVEVLTSGSRPQVIERLTIAVPPAIHAGTSYRFRAQASERNGSPVAFDSTTLRWRSINPDILSIDSISGLAVAIAPGQAVVHVSAGGWRQSALTVQVLPTRAVAVLHESWQQGLGAWQPFGEPAPTTQSHPELGHAMRSNGDGVFISGVYGKALLSATAGVTVEVDVASPIVKDKWQTLTVALSPSSDSPMLAAWDHRSSFPPGHRFREGNACGLSYPNGEGRRARAAVSVTGGARTFSIPVPPVVPTGKVYRLRVMLGADGRCHVAIDGVPLFVSSNVLPVDLPLRLWIFSNSVDTEIAFGKLTIWQGDPGGVDWLTYRTAEPPSP